MRELKLDELRAVSGGDDSSGNVVACQTAVSAGAVTVGLTFGVQAGAAAGALSVVGSELCQATTTYIGDSIGSAAASIDASITDFTSDLGYALDAMYTTFSWDTLGL